MKKYIVVLTLIVSSAMPAVAQEQLAGLGDSETLRRAELIRLVLERNPALEVVRARISAAEARVTGATYLDDPVLAAGIAPLSIGEETFGARVGVSQKLPWPGRLEKEGAVEKSAVALESAELERVRIDLALRASRLFDEWYLIHRAIELNEHHYEIAGQMKESAEAQYVSGVATQQDPLQAEVRMTALSRTRIGLDARVGTVRAAINALLHRSPGSRVPPPPSSLPAPSRVLMEFERQLDLAVDANSELAVAGAMVAKRDAELVIAELETRPDIEVMGEYSSMMMEDMRLMTGVRLRLPVRKGRTAAVVAAARASVESAAAHQASLKDEVAFSLERALIDLEQALETIAIYENRLIPASEDQAEAARIGFSTGRSGFFALTDAEENLEEVLLGYHRVVVDAWDAEARRQALLGKVPFVEGESR